MLRFARGTTEAGNTIEPARPVKLGDQEAPPYIQELLSQFAAVSTRVVLRGQSTFFHNEMCARLFMSTDQANELYASNMQASFMGGVFVLISTVRSGGFAVCTLPVAARYPQQSSCELDALEVNGLAFDLPS